MTSLRRRKPGVHGGSKQANNGDDNTRKSAAVIQSFNCRNAAASFFGLRPPRKRSTAKRPAAHSRTVTASSAGLGGLPAGNFAGSTNAIVAFEQLPDINTGVVMAIFCLAF